MTVCSMTPSTIIKFWKTLLNKRLIKKEDVLTNKITEGASVEKIRMLQHTYCFPFLHNIFMRRERREDENLNWISDSNCKNWITFEPTPFHPLMSGTVGEDIIHPKLWPNADIFCAKTPTDKKDTAQKSATKKSAVMNVLLYLQNDSKWMCIFLKVASLSHGTAEFGGGINLIRRKLTELKIKENLITRTWSHFVRLDSWVKRFLGKFFIGWAWELMNTQPSSLVSKECLGVFQYLDITIIIFLLLFPPKPGQKEFLVCLDNIQTCPIQKKKNLSLKGTFSRRHFLWPSPRKWNFKLTQTCNTAAMFQFWCRISSSVWVFVPIYTLNANDVTGRKMHPFFLAQNFQLCLCLWNLLRHNGIRCTHGRNSGKRSPWRVSNECIAWRRFGTLKGDVNLQCN